MDQVRERIRVLHYARATEKTYCYWIAFFIRWSGMRHPRDMGAAEVEAFLSHLATQREVAAGTQNQAMHAVLFLYKQVLGIQRSTFLINANGRLAQEWRGVKADGHAAEVLAAVRLLG